MTTAFGKSISELATVLEIQKASQTPNLGTIWLSFESRLGTVGMEQLMHFKVSHNVTFTDMIDHKLPADIQKRKSIAAI